MCDMGLILFFSESKNWSTVKLGGEDEREERVRIKREKDETERAREQTQHTPTNTASTRTSETKNLTNAYQIDAPAILHQNRPKLNPQDPD